MGSPVQRLMSRSTRNQLSSNQNQLEPVVKENVAAELSRLRQKQKYYADFNTVTRPTFKIGDNVAIQEKHREWYTGQIVENASTPRSYIVRTQDDKLLRRNSKHLRLAKVMIPRPKRTVVPEMTSQKAAPETTSGMYEQNHYHDQNHDTAQQVYSEASSSNVGMNTEETSQDRAAEPYRTRSGRTVKPLKRMDL
jgi:rRNA-processing protein FCF1